MSIVILRQPCPARVMGGPAVVLGGSYTDVTQCQRPSSACGRCRVRHSLKQPVVAVSGLLPHSQHLFRLLFFLSFVFAFKRFAVFFSFVFFFFSRTCGSGDCSSLGVMNRNDFIVTEERCKNCITRVKPVTLK